MPRREQPYFERFDPDEVDREADRTRELIHNNERSRESSFKGINKLLEEYYEKIYKEYESDIIDEDCAIKGKIDSKEREKQDKLMFERKRPDESNIEYELRAEKRDGMVWEKVITIIFNKILGENYLIVHSSKRDDNRGFDTLIVDKKTGEVICTFDEVETNLQSSRHLEKVAKVDKINKIGSVIKDGLILKNGKLEQKLLTDIPFFLLQITKEDFIKILSGMDLNSMDNVSDIEFEIFDKMIISLETQIENLKKPGYTKENLLEKVDKFSDSLEKMKEIRNKKL